MRLFKVLLYEKLLKLIKTITFRKRRKYVLIEIILLENLREHSFIYLWTKNNRRYFYHLIIPFIKECSLVKDILFSLLSTCV